jgi:hypothetical protein
MSYVHGQTKAAQEAKEAEDRARQKVAELAKLEAQLDARLKARREQMRYIKPVATYKPTPEAAAAWAHFQANNPNPEPPEHGWRRRAAAAKEAQELDARKRQAA